MRLEHFQLRAEYQGVTVQYREKQGFYAEAVPRQENTLASPVIQCKCEHTAKSCYAGLTPFLPGVKNHFRIAASSKFVSGLSQFLSQLTEIINFTVIHHAQLPVGAEHGLLAGRQVDDR